MVGKDEEEKRRPILQRTLIEDTDEEVAAQTGLSKEMVVAKVAEEVLLAAEAIGPEAVAEVAESLPEEILNLGAKEGERDG